MLIGNPSAFNQLRSRIVSAKFFTCFFSARVFLMKQNARAYALPDPRVDSQLGYVLGVSFCRSPR